MQAKEEKKYLPHQERVIEEKQQLDDKIAKLSAFVDSDGVANVEPQEVNLLKAQLIAMRSYSDMLGRRIRLW